MRFGASTGLVVASRSDEAVNPLEHQRSRCVDRCVVDGFSCETYDCLTQRAERARQLRKVGGGRQMLDRDLPVASKKRGTPDAQLQCSNLCSWNRDLSVLSTTRGAERGQRELE